jgi:hypothetical protein
MIVLVAGMPRSGSTLIYNIAREFLSARGDVEFILSNSLSFSAEKSTSRDKSVLIKSHAPDQAITELILSGQILCICTIRRPEDAIASWLNAFRFSLEDSLLHFEAWLKWHNYISKYSLNIGFDQIEKQLPATAMQIGNYLFGSISSDEVAIVSTKYSKDEVYKRSNELVGTGRDDVIDCGFSFYERDTLFHRRHVTSIIPRRAEEMLSSDQLAKIRLYLSVYLDSDGNYCTGLPE